MPTAPSRDKTLELLGELRAEIRAGLVFHRVTLRAIASLSPQARQSIGVALAEEAAMIEFDRLPHWCETLETVNEARRDLGVDTDSSRFDR